MTAGELLDAAHRFPFRSLDERLGIRPFIVIAPHPDDESLACGGLIAEACKEGRRVGVIVVSDGSASHPNSRSYPPSRLIALREGEARRASAELGVAPADISFLGLADRCVPRDGADSEGAICQIADRVKGMDAASLFVSWRHDPHCDHQASYEIARAVQTRVRGLNVFEYVVWGSELPPATEVQPIKGGFRIRIEQALEKKRRAIASHRSQTTDLIADDPGGFRLTARHLSRFDLPYEFFFESDA